MSRTELSSCQFILAPGTLTEDLIEVQGDFTLLNQTFDFLGKFWWQNPHQSLGGEPVLGSLLVVSLRHVTEHNVSSLVDVVDDLAKVGFEVGGGQVLQVRQSCGGNISLPLKITLACFNHISDAAVLLTEGSEGLGELQFIAGNGTASSRESEVLLLVLRTGFSGQVSCLPHVGGEDDQVEVLVDVVHDLHLEESLGGVVHDLVAQLGLCDVLSELLDASTSGLGGSILVNDFVALILCCGSVCESVDELLYNLELSSEERVLL